jgi:hypothetical protein
VGRVARYGRIDKKYATGLATCDPAEDGGIYMLNLMKYRAEADYGAGGEHGVSGREADDRYAPVDVLKSIGAVVCFTADVAKGSEEWDRVAVVRYPTRRSFIEMQSRGDFQAKHVHKQAGMDHTIVMGTLPTSALPGRAKPQQMLLEVWNGSTPTPVVAGPSATFDVEGTIVGDERPWTGARYTPIERDVDFPLDVASTTHQVLVLAPTIERWA